MTPPGQFRICPLCEAACGLRIEHADGRVLRIRGAEDDPFSQGYLCPKAVALKDLHEDPHRLRRPLVKRAGRFVEVTWDEAFAEVEARLNPIRQQHGPDSVALLQGNPTVHRLGHMLYGTRLARALGSRNVFSASTLDQMPRQLANGLLYGQWLSNPVPDIDRTDFLLVIGANPMVSNGSMWTVPDYRGRAKALRARGGRIVVVDPRRTETAEWADQHLPIRPGGDPFFLAALVHTLFQEGLARPGRLGDFLAPGSLDALRTFMDPYPPERVAAACGLGADAIRHLARNLAAAPRAAVYGRIGTCTQRFGTVNSWLVDALNILTGNLDREGGAMFPQAPAFAINTQPRPGKGIRTGRRHSRVSAAPEVMGELPMTLFAEEALTPGAGQVRAAITMATNPVLSAPDGAALEAAFSGLDFMLSVDAYVNATTRHADVILPDPSPLESPHYDVAFSQLAHRNAARWSDPMFATDQPPDWDTLLRLCALVQGQPWQGPIEALDEAVLSDALAAIPEAHRDAVRTALGPQPGPARLVDLALRTGPYGDRFGLHPAGLNLRTVRAAPTGIDLGPLQARLPALLKTASGCIELAPPELLAQGPALADALREAPPALVVIGRREVRNNNSWMHQLPVLAKGPARCVLWLHPADAARAGLQDGDWAELSSATGCVRVPVHCTEALREGVVSLPHGMGPAWDAAVPQPGVNLNALLPAGERDALSGNAVLSGVPVQLRRAPA